jgi:hypothetical protein
MKPQKAKALLLFPAFAVIACAVRFRHRRRHISEFQIPRDRLMTNDRGFCSTGVSLEGFEPREMETSRARRRATEIIRQKRFRTLQMPSRYNF